MLFLHSFWPSSLSIYLSFPSLFFHFLSSLSLLSWLSICSHALLSLCAYLFSLSLLISFSLFSHPSLSSLTSLALFFFLSLSLLTRSSLTLILFSLLSFFSLLSHIFFPLLSLTFSPSSLPQLSQVFFILSEILAENVLQSEFDDSFSRISGLCYHIWYTRIFERGICCLFKCHLASAGLENIFENSHTRRKSTVYQVNTVIKWTVSAMNTTSKRSPELMNVCARVQKFKRVKITEIKQITRDTSSCNKRCAQTSRRQTSRT